MKINAESLPVEVNSNPSLFTHLPVIWLSSEILFINSFKSRATNFKSKNLGVRIFLISLDNILFFSMSD